MLLTPHPLLTNKGIPWTFLVEKIKRGHGNRMQKEILGGTGVLTDIVKAKSHFGDYK